MKSNSVIKQALAKVKRDPALFHLNDNVDLLDDVGLDSLETLQFLLEIEDLLGRAIDYDRLEYDMLRSINRLCDFLDGNTCSPS